MFSRHQPVINPMPNLDLAWLCAPSDSARQIGIRPAGIHRTLDGTAEPHFINLRNNKLQTSQYLVYLYTLFYIYIYMHIILYILLISYHIISYYIILYYFYIICNICMYTNAWTGEWHTQITQILIHVNMNRTSWCHAIVLGCILI